MSRLVERRWEALQELRLRDPARANSTRLGQFGCGALLVMDGLVVSGLPVNEFAAIGLILIGLTQLVRPGLKFPVAMAAGMISIALWLGFSNVLNNDPINIRRVGHLLVWTALAYTFASGRLHLPSVFKGASAGVLAGTGIYLAGIHVTYPGRLSGYLGDPNATGMTITAYGLALIAVLARTRAQQVALTLAVAGIVALTLSRTTLAALAMAIVWVLTATRIKPIFSVAMVAGLMQYLRSLPPTAAQSGVFADRVGSDNLRDRLLALEQTAVQNRLWVGNGAGTAKVQLPGGSEFFFHNSYLALRAEGGWIALGLFLLVLASVVWPAMRARVGDRNPWLEAAVVVPLICAINLGEVLLALPIAVALGMLWHQYASRQLDRDERGRMAKPHPALRGADPRDFR